MGWDEIGMGWDGMGCAPPGTSSTQIGMHMHTTPRIPLAVRSWIHDDAPRQTILRDPAASGISRRKLDPRPDPIRPDPRAVKRPRVVGSASMGSGRVGSENVMGSGASGGLEAAMMRRMGMDGSGGSFVAELIRFPSCLGAAGVGFVPMCSQPNRVVWDSYPNPIGLRTHWDPNPSVGSTRSLEDPLGFPSIPPTLPAPHGSHPASPHPTYPVHPLRIPPTTGWNHPSHTIRIPPTTG